MERMNNISKALLILSSLFVIKGVFRPSNRRNKGSANRHLNVILNVTLAIITIGVLLIVSDAIFAEGKVGTISRMIMALIAACYIVLLRGIIRLGPFTEYIWIDDAFEVGDVIMINNVEHEVVDFWLKGDFYLVCKEVATGNKVTMGSYSIMEATIGVGNVTYLGSL